MLSTRKTIFALAILAVFLFGCSMASTPVSVPDQNPTVGKNPANTNVQDFPLQEYTNQTSAFTFIRPAALIHCEEQGPGNQGSLASARCHNGTSPEDATHFEAVVFMKVSNESLHDNEWQEIQVDTMEYWNAYGTIKNFQVTGRQIEIEVDSTADDECYWILQQEREGIVMTIVLAVPVGEQQAYAAVWPRIKNGMVWDSGAFKQVVVQQPVHNATVPPIAPTQSLEACLPLCDIYTNNDLWFQCVTGCTSGEQTPTPSPSDVDPAYQQCIQYCNTIEDVVVSAKCTLQCNDAAWARLQPTLDALKIEVPNQDIIGQPPTNCASMRSALEKKKRLLADMESYEFKSITAEMDRKRLVNQLTSEINDLEIKLLQCP